MIGCEVWRFNGTSWSCVVGPGAGVGRGFGDPDNHAVTSMAVFGGHLYAGTGNETSGLQVWRSADGTSWERTDGGAFGTGNSSASSMEVFKGRLFLGTFNDSGCVIFSSSNGTTWMPVTGPGIGDADNIGAKSMALFTHEGVDYLYVGTYNTHSGLRVYRTLDGLVWSRTDGNLFGLSNVGALSMGVYDGQLYVGTRNNGGNAQLWRATDGSSWTRVAGPSLDYDDSEFTSMLPDGSRLLLGTRNGCGVWSFDGTWQRITSGSSPIMPTNP